MLNPWNLILLSLVNLCCGQASHQLRASRMQSPDAIARAYINGAGCGRSQLGCSGLAEALETMVNGLPLNNQAVVDVCSSPDVVPTGSHLLRLPRDHR